MYWTQNKKGKKMYNYTLYLAGQISSNPSTYQWRARVRDYYRTNPFIRVIDPCSSEFNLQVLSNGDPNGKGYSEKSLVEKGINLLPFKDRGYVKESNVLFFDLNIYSPQKPSIGTFFELAWAFDDPSKIIIGILRGDLKESWLFNHPFIKNSIQEWVENEMEACVLLDRFMDIPELDSIKSQATLPIGTLE
jgi:hypothetical protein